jgi:hypothetical protein
MIDTNSWLHVRCCSSLYGVEYLQNALTHGMYQGSILWTQTRNGRIDWPGGLITDDTTNTRPIEWSAIVAAGGRQGMR